MKLFDVVVLCLWYVCSYVVVVLVLSSVLVLFGLKWNLYIMLEVLVL